MTFSDLAKVLYPYYGGGLNKTEFVVLLVNKIMCGRPGRAHQDGTYQNPLQGKNERILLSYFNGERNIPRGDASIILSSIDKYKFEMYLRNYCSEPALALLKSDVSQMVSMKDTEDVIEVCADQFEAIIKSLASNE